MAITMSNLYVVGAMRPSNDQIHANLIAPRYKHADREAEFNEGGAGTRSRPDFDEYIRHDGVIIVDESRRSECLEARNNVEKKPTSTPPNLLVVGVCLILACALGYIGQGWGGL